MDEFKLPPTRQAKMQALNPLMGLTILIKAPAHQGRGRKNWQG